MSKLIPALILCLFLASCHDMKKQEQLGEVRAMIAEVDGAGIRWQAAQTDSVQVILAEVEAVEADIRKNYDFDTISIEFSQKLEDYKAISKGLRKFAADNDKIVEGLAQEKQALSALQGDIEKASGDRSKYGDYIRFEQNKVAQLRVLMESDVETKRKCVLSYQRLHAEVKAFSESR